MKKILDILNEQFTGTILDAWYDEKAKVFITENLGDAWKCKVEIRMVKTYNSKYFAQVTVLESNLCNNKVQYKDLVLQ